MVNGQTIGEAEQQVTDIESQLATQQQSLATQEAQIRQSFIPGTIQSQLELGSAQALRTARLELGAQQQAGLLGIAQQREELVGVEEQLQTRRQEISDVRARKREVERRRRVAIVERKIALKKIGERPSDTQIISQAEEQLQFTLTPLAREELLSTRSLSISGISALSSLPSAPLSAPTFVSLSAPSSFVTPPPQLQSLATPSDLGLTPSISSRRSLFTQQGDFDLPSRTGGLLTVAEGTDLGVRGAVIEPRTTRESFVSAVGRGAIIGQFRAPTQDPFISPTFGPSQEFIETERATALEAGRVAQFVTGAGRAPGLTDPQFQQQLGDIRAGAITQARDEFATLPSGTRRGARVASLAQVGSRLGVGTAELGLTVISTFGQQTPGRPRRVEFAEGTAFGDVLGTPFLRPSTDILGRVGPQALGTGAIIAPAIGLGVRQFARQARQTGLFEAGVETGSVISPFRLSTQTLTPQTTFQSGSLTFQRGDTATRIGGGLGIQDPRVGFVRRESLRTTEGGQVTGLFVETTEFPIIDIAGGGAFVRPSTRVITRRGKIDAGSVDLGSASLIGETPRGLVGAPLRGEFGIGATRTLSQPIRRTDIDPFGISTRQPVPASPRFQEAESLSFFQRTGRVTGSVSREGRGIDIRFDVPTATDVESFSIGRGGAGRSVRTTQAPSLDFQPTFRGPTLPRPSPRTTRPTSLDVIGIESSRIADLPTLVGGRGQAPTASLGIAPRGGFDFQPTSTGPLSLTFPGATRTGLGIGVGATRTGLVTGLDSRVRDSQAFASGIGLALGVSSASASRTALGLFQPSAVTQAQVARQFQPSAQAQAQALSPRLAQSQQVFPGADIFGRGGRGRGLGIPITGFPLPGIGRPSGPSKKRTPRKRRARQIPIRPSFTAEVLDLTATEQLIPSAQFGISPFEIRRRLVRAPKKKKSKKKVKKKK